MLISNWKIAFRSIRRNLFYSIVNGLGLAIGIGICLVIFLVVEFELSFDRFQPDRDRIYRIYSQYSMGINSGAPVPIRSVIENEFTGIESVTNFHIFDGKVEVSRLNGERESFGSNDKIIITSSDYFDVFNYHDWIIGSPKQSLHEPNRVVLTQSRVRLYFGNVLPAEVIGREIHYRDSLTVTVSGIIRDLNKRTDFDFNEFISYRTIESSWLRSVYNIQSDSWQSVSDRSQLFIKLFPNTPVSRIEDQIPKLSTFFAEKYNHEWGFTIKLQPLNDIHFNTSVGIFSHSRAPVERPTIYILISVALILLAIASINFVNLEIAQALNRAKEVGVRKVLGGTKQDLIARFLFQTFIITCFSAILSIGFSFLAIEYFREYIPSEVKLDITEFPIISFFICSIILVSFLAGFYPAFVISSFRPVSALRNNVFLNSGVHHSYYVRKGLFVFQFSFSQILIIVTITVWNQISFLLNNELGFSTDGIVYFYVPWQEKVEKKFLLKHRLEQLSEVEELSLSSPPCLINSNRSTIYFDNDREVIRTLAVIKSVDPSFLSLYDIGLVSGRNITLSDSTTEYLVNETFMKEMGYQDPQEIIGKPLYKDSFIVGVVKDFHTASKHTPIEPVVIDNKIGSYFAIKLRSKKESSAAYQDGLQLLTTIWKEVYPDHTFNYRFLSETIAKFYEKEMQMGKLTIIAAIISVLISCLGLLGLSSLIVTQRTKEVGIRKVFGGTTKNIVLLLSKEFLQLVMIGIAIAVPIAYYVANDWLSFFAYREGVRLWIFVASASISLILTYLTISIKTFEVATFNPSKSLRYE